MSLAAALLMVVGGCGEGPGDPLRYSDLYNRVLAGEADLQKGIESVPGFGGLRIDPEQCETTVFLEEPLSAAARQAARRAFGHELNRFAPRCGETAQVRYERARGNYQALDSLRQAAVAGWDGFTIAEVDPLAGRIVFNVSRTRDLAPARAAIQRARIPRSAYELHVAPGFDHFSPGIFAKELSVGDESGQPVPGFAVVIRKNGVVQDSIVSGTAVYVLEFEFPGPDAAARYTLTVIPPSGYSHCPPLRPVAKGIRIYSGPVMRADNLQVSQKGPEACRLPSTGS